MTNNERLLEKIKLLEENVKNKNELIEIFREQKETYNLKIDALILTHKNAMDKINLSMDNKEVEISLVHSTKKRIKRDTNSFAEKIVEFTDLLLKNSSTNGREGWDTASLGAIKNSAIIIKVHTCLMSNYY